MLKTIDVVLCDAKIFAADDRGKIKVQNLWLGSSLRSWEEQKKSR